MDTKKGKKKAGQLLLLHLLAQKTGCGEYQLVFGLTHRMLLVFIV
jgi:hypothetical protein